MAWVDKNEWDGPFPGGYAPRRGRTQRGQQNYGLHRSKPSPYQAMYADFPFTVWRDPVTGYLLPAHDVRTLWFFHFFGSNSDPFPAARNASWESLVENIRGTTADLAVTMAQWNEAMGMIALRGGQLVRAARALRKGRFRKFTRELRVNPKRKHRNLTRKQVVNDFSGLWLEYSFGWSPLFGDIYNAADAIQQPLPSDKFIGRGRETYARTNLEGIAEWFYTTGRCEQGATVFLENPNLYLLQQMGVANPLLVAWEVIPFSFVVDWVFDVSAFLGSVSDFIGLRLEDTYTTYSVGHTSVTFGLINQTGDDYLVTGRCAQMRRRTGLSRPMPNMSFLANIGTNWRRAANAVSLLGVLLTGR